MNDSAAFKADGLFIVFFSEGMRNLTKKKISSYPIIIVPNKY